MIRRLKLIIARNQLFVLSNIPGLRYSRLTRCSYSDLAIVTVFMPWGTVQWLVLTMFELALLNVGDEKFCSRVWAMIMITLADFPVTD